MTTELTTKRTTTLHTPDANESGLDNVDDVFIVSEDRRKLIDVIYHPILGGIPVRSRPILRETALHDLQLYKLPVVLRFHLGNLVEF